MSPTDAPPHRATARFALFTAASPIHDPAALRPLLDPYLEPLRELGAESWEPGAGPPAAPLVVFVATGGTERLILETARFEDREAVVLLAHPGHNSLPASLEVLARAHQLGIRGEIVYLTGPGDREGLERLAAAVHDRAVRRAMLGCRIGLVGAPSDWLVASRPSHETVRSVWGPIVVPLSLESLMEEPDGVVAASGERLARDFRTGAESPVEPADDDVLASGRVHAMLRRLVDAHRLDALTVRCFDLVVRRHMTGCLALAQLTDEGVIAGCEGDLVTTVTMLWLHRLLGSIPWMANPSRVDRARGVLSLAHCTVPRGAATTYRLRSHFESGLGVGLQGTLATGPVTLARIGGERMERLYALDGMLVGNTDHPDLCRTQVEVEVGRAALDDLLAHPLGNHLVLVPGRHAARLRHWHETMIA